MRIAVISDIHSNLDAFRAVIEKLPPHDALLCLGDVVGYGPQPNEVVKQLLDLCPTTVLMGNHDYAVVTGDTSGFSEHAAEAVEWTRRKITEENLRYLSKLKASAKLELGGFALALFHGSPRDPLSEYVFPGIPDQIAKWLIKQAKAPLVLLGHTHMPMAYWFQSQLLGNPGSVGQPRDGDARASFAILNISGPKMAFEIHRTGYDVDSAARKITAAGLPSFLAERLYVGM